LKNAEIMWEVSGKSKLYVAKPREVKY